MHDQDQTFHRDASRDAPQDEEIGLLVSQWVSIAAGDLLSLTRPDIAGDRTAWQTLGTTTAAPVDRTNSHVTGED
jgi:hypothetical protein